jgi:hypothetical protein
MELHDLGRLIDIENEITYSLFIPFQNAIPSREGN